MTFNFFCCQKCRLLHASLHQALNNREKIRHKKSNVCWHLLSGMNPKRDVQHYMDQIIGIFKVSSFWEGFMVVSIIIPCFFHEKLPNHMFVMLLVYCKGLTLISVFIGCISRNGYQ